MPWFILSLSGGQSSPLLLHLLAFSVAPSSDKGHLVISGTNDYVVSVLFLFSVNEVTRAHMVHGHYLVGVPSSLSILRPILGMSCHMAINASLSPFASPTGIDVQVLCWL